MISDDEKVEQVILALEFAIVWTTNDDGEWGWGRIFWRAAYEYNNLEYRDWVILNDADKTNFEFNWPLTSLPEGLIAVKCFPDGRVAGRLK